MSKVLQIETGYEESKLLVVNLQKKQSRLFLLVLSHFKKISSVYLYSSKVLQFSKVHTLSRLAPYTLSHIKDKIDYCIVFPSCDVKDTVSHVQKVTAVCGKIIIVLDRQNLLSAATLQESLGQYSNVSYALVGEVFGSNFLNTDISRNIANSTTRGYFELQEDTLQPVFCVSENDLLAGFEYILFKAYNSSKTYPLYYEIPNTNTSLMHSLKRIEHELSVRYVKSANKTRRNLLLDEESVMKNFISYDNHIRKVFDGFEKEAKNFIEQGFIAKNFLEEKKWFFLNHVKKIGKTVGLIAFSFLLFIAVSIVALFISITFFKNSSSAAISGNFNKAEKDIAIAQMLFNYSKPQVLFTTKSIDILSGSNTAKLVDSYSDLLHLGSEVYSFMKTSFVSGNEISAENANSFLGSAMLLYFLFQNNAPYELGSSELYKNYVPLLSIFNEALGFSKEMRYLVLLQNNNELRPTGGFIGSVATLTVKNGKILQTDVRDVYELDGQLKEHVEPNFIIRRYLQPHLYLRDSNFNPDFPTTASSAAYLYNLETGDEIDGVIAIDTEVLKTLIDVVGPISLPGVRGKATRDNIIPIVQESIRDDFFPGSSEKRNLLNTIFSKIVILTEEDFSVKISLLKKIPDLLSHKHIQISFNKDALEKGVAAAGIAGSLQDKRLEEGRYLDTIGINEANIGVNKVNEFVTRNVSISNYLKEAELATDLSVLFENKGSEDYTMYLRIIAPRDSLLDAVIIDDVNQKVVPAVTDPVFYEKKGFVAPDGLEVADELLPYNLKSFGLRIVVSKGSKKEIRLMLKRPFFELPSSIMYSLRYVKQPGTPPYPLHVALQTDPQFKKSSVNDPVLFNGEIKSDLEWDVSLRKTN